MKVNNNIENNCQPGRVNGQGSGRVNVLGREAAKKLEATLRECRGGERKADEINRALALNQGGIKELSDGTKINTSKVDEQVLGGGKEELEALLKNNKGAISDTLSDSLYQEFLDAINEGKTFRDSETGSPLVSRILSEHDHAQHCLLKGSGEGSVMLNYNKNNALKQNQKETIWLGEMLDVKNESGKNQLLWRTTHITEGRHLRDLLKAAKDLGKSVEIIVGCHGDDNGNMIFSGGDAKKFAEQDVKIIEESGYDKITQHKVIKKGDLPSWSNKADWVIFPWCFSRRYDGPVTIDGVKHKTMWGGSYDPLLKNLVMKQEHSGPEWLKESIHESRCIGVSDWKKLGIHASIIDEKGSEKKPNGLVQYLNAKCPITNQYGVVVKDTHMVIWIPKGMTVEILQNALSSNNVTDSEKLYFYSTEYLKEYLEKNVWKKEGDKGEWVLMYDGHNGILPGSTNNTYAKQNEQLDGYGNGYQVPDARSVILATLMKKQRTGESMYANPVVYTRCQDIDDHSESRVVVGNFNRLGFRVYVRLACSDDDDDKFEGNGLGAILRF